MIDRAMLYNIIYALAARGGRQDALFGQCAPLARDAFSRSLVASAFPELWFELPLLGDPWFDLHCGTWRRDLPDDAGLLSKSSFANPGALAWFFEQGGGARQLFCSWDVSSGDISWPATQLLVRDNSPQVVGGFLTAAGKPDAAPSYQAFFERLPQGWFACYIGVFPSRPGFNLRVECIPAPQLQRAYAQDPRLLREHLQQVGVREFGDTLVERCCELAASPYQLEFQFDVDEQGAAEQTFSASLRFASLSDKGGEPGLPYDQDGAAGQVMQKVEAWGLADKRWRLLADTMYAQRVSFGGDTCRLFCHPAFVKLRWRDGEPVDAKAYLIAGVQ